MKEIIIQCDRCGKMVSGMVSIDNKITSGYYNVADGTWSQFARWEEESVCDACMFEDANYKLEYGSVGR